MKQHYLQEHYVEEGALQGHTGVRTRSSLSDSYLVTAFTQQVMPIHTVVFFPLMLLYIFARPRDTPSPKPGGNLLTIPIALSGSKDIIPEFARMVG